MSNEPWDPTSPSESPSTSGPGGLAETEQSVAHPTAPGQGEAATGVPSEPPAAPAETAAETPRYGQGVQPHYEYGATPSQPLPHYGESDPTPSYPGSTGEPGGPQGGYTMQTSGEYLSGGPQAYRPVPVDRGNAIALIVTSVVTLFACLSPFSLGSLVLGIIAAASAEDRDSYGRLNLIGWVVLAAGVLLTVIAASLMGFGFWLFVSSAGS